MRRSLPFLLVVLLLGILPAAAQAEDRPRRVAVLYFENTGNPELEMLKLGLAQMLIQDLTGTPGLEVIERGRINELLGELDLQKSDRVDQSKAVELGKLLGVERVVLGSYFDLLGQFQLMARVVDVETGVIVGASEAQGVVADFGKLEDQIAEGILPHLAPTPAGGGSEGSKERGEDEANDRTSATAAETTRGRTGRKKRRAPAGGKTTRGGAKASSTTPASTEDRGESYDKAPPRADGGDEAGAGEASDPLGAALAFSEGLDYLDRKDISRARDALRRAVELDPGLDDARSELARLDL